MDGQNPGKPPEVKEELIPVVPINNIDGYADQLSLLLIYVLDKLGGFVELPTMPNLWEWCEGRTVTLTRNTDGTAQLISSKKGESSA